LAENLALVEDAARRPRRLYTIALLVVKVALVEQI
jgi:hypothetical protein